MFLYFWSVHNFKLKDYSDPILTKSNLSNLSIDKTVLLDVGFFGSRLDVIGAFLRSYFSTFFSIEMIHTKKQTKKKGRTIIDKKEK